MKKIIISMILAFLLAISFVSALTISNVDVSQVKPGSTTEISIILYNNGDNLAKDISIKLDFSAVINQQTGAIISPELPFAPFESSSIKSVDEIDEGKSKIVYFTIQALSNAKSGLYKIPVIITYTEDVTPATPAKTVSDLISVTVNSLPVLDVQREGGLLLKGQENTVVLKIVNKGLSDINFLEVDLDDSIGYSVTSPKRVYIGTIASDDTDTAQFTVYFNQNSPNIVNFPVTLIYNDVANKKYSEQFSVDAKAYSQKEAITLGLVKKSNVGLYITLVIVIIILYLIYRRLRKYMKNRKNNSIK